MLIFFKEFYRQTYFLPALNAYLPKIVQLLKSSGSGFFAKSGVTWVDFLISDYMISAFKAAPEIDNKFPELKNHIEKVQKLAQLQKYLKNRPQTEW